MAAETQTIRVVVCRVTSGGYQLETGRAEATPDSSWDEKLEARLIVAGRAGPKSSRSHSSSPNSNPAISVHFYNSTYYPNTK